MKKKSSLGQSQNQKMRLVYSVGATIIVALIVVFSFVFNIGNVRHAFAVSGTKFTSSGNNVTSNWNSPATWGLSGNGGPGVGYPGPNDQVEIHQGDVVVVNIAGAQCSSMLLGGTVSTDGTLTFASTGSPTLAVGTTITGNTGSGSGYITMVSSATLTVAGTVSSSSGDGFTITMASNSTLSADHFADGGGGLVTNFNNGTVIYTGTSNPTSILTTPYNNLTIASTSGVETLAGATTVNGNLTITSGTLALSTYALDMKGNFTNNGTFSTGTGTVTFDNTTAQTVGGSTGPSFYNLTINNSAGVTLTGPVTVSHTLTLTAGVLALSTYKLTIASTGSITGAGSTHYVETNSTGVLEMTASHTSPGTLFPVGDGYNPITILPTTDAVFDVSIANGITDKLGAVITKHAVGITWTVKLTSGTQNVTVTPQWNLSPDELTSFARATSYVAYRTTSPTGNWINGTSGAALGANPYTRVSSSISMASTNTYYIGVGDNVGALPVTLVSFSAAYENNKVDLNWATASEINNHYFNIERSTDGANWQTTARVEGHGNSTVTQNYSESDDLAGIIPTGDIYYRLKQVDFNGASTYSMIRSVSIGGGKSNLSLSVYPNPTSRELNVNWNSDENSNATLRILNITGATLYTENITGTGSMHKQIDMSAYKSGTYFVQIVTDKNTSSQTVIKK